MALAVNGVPIDALAERLGTTRGALYKTLHDARAKLRPIWRRAEPAPSGSGGPDEAPRGRRAGAAVAARAGPAGARLRRVLRLPDRYVDLEVAGADADAAIPGMREHLLGAPPAARSTPACGRSPAEGPSRRGDKNARRRDTHAVRPTSDERSRTTGAHVIVENGHRPGALAAGGTLAGRGPRAPSARSPELSTPSAIAAPASTRRSGRLGLRGAPARRALPGDHLPQRRRVRRAGGSPTSSSRRCASTICCPSSGSLTSCLPARRAHRRPLEAAASGRAPRPAPPGPGAADRVEVADWLERALLPRGVAVVMEATHMCMSLRGVRQPGARTTTLRAPRPPARRPADPPGVLRADRAPRGAQLTPTEETSTTPRTIVIVGAGLAGEGRRDAARGGLRRPPGAGRRRGRAPLRAAAASKDHLRGESGREAVYVHEPGFYEGRAIELRVGTAATAIDPAERTVTLTDGERLRWTACCSRRGRAAPAAGARGASRRRALPARPRGLRPPAQGRCARARAWW